MAQGKDVQYAREMLAFNPAYDVDRVLDRRDRYFGVTSENESSLLDSFQRRQAAEQKLEQIRQAFWDSKPQTLQQHLAIMPVNELPELRVVVERLTHVARLRDMFTQLERHPACQPMLLNALRRIVVLPPREAGAFREQMLRSVRASENLHLYKKMIGVLKQEFHPIYQLESDWLENVVRQRKRSRATSNGGGGVEMPEVQIPAWVFIIGIIVLIRLLRFLI